MSSTRSPVLLPTPSPLPAHMHRGEGDILRPVWITGFALLPLGSALVPDTLCVRGAVPIFSLYKGEGYEEALIAHRGVGRSFGPWPARRRERSDRHGDHLAHQRDNEHGHRLVLGN